MDIARTIKDILVSDIFVDIPVDQIDLDSSLRDVLGLDSLGFLELRVQCEDRFGIVISDDEFSPENFSTIANVIQLVEHCLAAGENADASTPDTVS